MVRGTGSVAPIVAGGGFRHETAVVEVVALGEVGAAVAWVGGGGRVPVARGAGSVVPLVRGRGWGHGTVVRRVAASRKPERRERGRGELWWRLQ